MSDWTATFKDLYPTTNPDAVEMYSYGRAASLFWNGYANELEIFGWTRDQIIEHCCSKATRWMLDEHDERLEALGAELARLTIINPEVRP